jgi:RNA polymerase sigma-70 factor (ECF subfamily)
VYAVAYRMTMNEADAEAVVRTAIRRVARGPAPLEPRLYRVTVNAVLALRRRRGVTPVPGAAAPGGDRRVRLEAAIARLPPEYRDPFVLSDVERLSGAEVGDLLGLAAGVVQGRLHRARLMLCAALRTAG